MTRINGAVPGSVLKAVLSPSRRTGPLPRLGRYRENRTRGDTMTTVTRRDLGPDKRAAEMSDSDEAEHANGADLPAARGGSSRWTHGDPVDRRHQHAWVPGSAALLTWLIGLSDIVAIFRPDLVHKLHKINYLVPGTLTTVTRSADVIIGLMLLMLAHGLRRRKRRAWQSVAALLVFDIGIHVTHTHRMGSTIVAAVLLVGVVYF